MSGGAEAPAGGRDRTKTKSLPLVVGTLNYHEKKPRIGLYIYIYIIPGSMYLYPIHHWNLYYIFDSHHTIC